MDSVRRFISMFALAVLAAACASPRTTRGTSASSSRVLFGSPAPQSGLSSAQCQARCEGMPDPRSFSGPELATLRSAQLDEPFADVVDDPYASPLAAQAGVCAVLVTDLATRRYALRTFSSEAAAMEHGATVTHHDGCGVCSTLQDLAVYAADPDLGAPVRRCAQDTLLSSHEDRVVCLEKLGFTRPCASIWAFNIESTRARCLGPCLLNGSDPYHGPDGSLNSCLACDERESGPVFKAVAGRTRRNTGIPTAICRPCSEARSVPHNYPWLLPLPHDSHVGHGR